MAMTFVGVLFCHAIWGAAFFKSIPDMDYGQFAYSGFFAAKDRQLSHLTQNPIYLGFKIGVYYIMGGAFYLLPKWYAPRILFCFWNTLSCCFLLWAIPSVSWPVAILFMLLSLAPVLGSLYLQAEFWAMLPSCFLLFLTLSPSFWGKDCLFGCALLINPLLFKPTYIFESFVFFFFYSGSHLAAVSSIVIFFGILLLLLRNTAIMRGTLYGVRTGNILSYFLKWGRSKSVTLQSLLVFWRELLILAFPSVLFVPFLDRFSFSLLAAQFLGGAIQMRGFRHHFMGLVPILAFAGGNAPDGLVWIAAMPALFSMLQVGILRSKQKQDAFINRAIPHYQRRNVASFVLAAWLVSHSKANEKILVVGETPQLNILVGRRSPRYFLDFDPHTASASPEVQNDLLEACRTAPPQYLVIMQDCLNWDFFEIATGLTFKHVHEITVGCEAFPVYELVKIEDPDLNAKGRLFFKCKYVTPNGQHIWNWGSEREK